MSAGAHDDSGHRKRRGARTLNAEERALWRGVARSITPLHGRTRHAVEDDVITAVEALAPAHHKAKSKPKPIAPAPRPTRPSAPPPLAPLARREKQQLARGRATIDKRIDLHGMTQAEAHAALAHFLRRAQHDGARFVLVITGKGTRQGERGVLRRQVPLWLQLPEFRHAVIGFEEAHVGHGGEGALYVRLRKMRE
jgi:DNA-nicking Smr family endonuclease